MNFSMRGGGRGGGGGDGAGWLIAETVVMTTGDDGCGGCGCYSGCSYGHGGRADE